MKNPICPECHKEQEGDLSHICMGADDDPARIPNLPKINGITVKEMVVNSLKEMGADGLCDQYECSCLSDDLCPCDRPLECAPMKKVPCPFQKSEDCDCRLDNSYYHWKELK